MNNLSYVSTIENNTSLIAEDIGLYKAFPKNIIDSDLLDIIQQSKPGTYVDESTFEYLVFKSI